MSTRTFEQYKAIFDAAVEQHKDNAFYASQVALFGLPNWPTAPKRSAIIGIRHDGADVRHRENKADDMIVLCGIDANGNQFVKEYGGTTESGLFNQVINPLGDFKMFPGFYFFKKGLHKQTHPCLVQAAPVRGQRAKKGQDYAGDFAITDGSLHLHAGILNPDNVGNWSAGCTVIKGGWEGPYWKEFWGIVDGSGQKLFPYVLVNESDIA